MSAWAEKYRVLTLAAESGSWRNDRTPYLVEPMDAANNPLVREIVMMAPSQIGKTEYLLNCVLYHVHILPCPQMLIQPTDLFAKDFSRERLSGAIEKCPPVRGKVSDVKSRDGSNRITGKQYPGGMLVLVGSNAPMGLASRPIRRLYCDELDRFADSAGTEGDPIKLGEARTVTFPDAKIFKVSSPTLEGSSKIDAAYQLSDKREWEMPCPWCESYQVLKFERIFKEDERPATYQCEHCQAQIEHREKREMLNRGRWTPRAPFNGTAGFHFGGESGPWVSWDQLVVEYHKVKSDREELQVFYNTKLGRVYKEEYLVVDLSGTIHDGETYAFECPPGVLALTAGVDVQGNRLECCVIGWGLGDEAWVLDYHQIHGDPDGSEVWEKLQALLSKEYRSREWTVRVERVGIDCSYLSQQVYKKCRENAGRGWFAVRGWNRPRVPLLSRPYRIGPHKEWEYYRCGTNWAKGDIFRALAIKEQGPRFVHFPARDEDRYRLIDDEFFRQLYAETPIQKNHDGEMVTVYEKKSPSIRNEVLDTFVYNWAARKLLNPNYEALHEERHKPDEPETPRPRRSFVKNW